MCIVIVEIWFGIANGQFSSILAELSAHDTSDCLFPDDNSIKYQWIFSKLALCIDIVEIWFGFANGQVSSVFDSYLPMTHPYFLFRTKLE